MLSTFLHHCAATAPADIEAIERTLKRAASEARTAWPEIPMDADAFAGHLAEKLSPDEGMLDQLRKLRYADLFLTWATLQGDTSALAAFEAELLPEVTQAARKLRSSRDAMDELAQEMRERLLVGEGERGPRLRDYAGRGPLGRWIEATAIRMQLNKTRGKKREVLIDDQPVFDALLGEGLPPSDPRKAAYRDAFAKAFAAAIESLAADDKLVLRLTYVDRLGLAALGATLGVSRATAHRRLVKARDQLARRTEEQVQTDLKIEASELASLRRQVQSQIHVSISRLLDS